jgi:hypothetical protein
MLPFLPRIVFFFADALLAPALQVLRRYPDATQPLAQPRQTAIGIFRPIRCQTSTEPIPKHTAATNGIWLPFETHYFCYSIDNRRYDIGLSNLLEHTLVMANH